MEHLEILLNCLTEEEIKNLYLNLESIAKNMVFIAENGPVEKLLFRLASEIERRKNQTTEEIKKLDDNLIYKVLTDEDIEKLQYRLKAKFEAKTILEKTYIEKLLNELNEEKNKRTRAKKEENISENLKNIKL